MTRRVLAALIISGLALAGCAHHAPVHGPIAGAPDGTKDGPWSEPPPAEAYAEPARQSVAGGVSGAIGALLSAPGALVHDAAARSGRAAHAEDVHRLDHTSWGPPLVVPAALKGPRAVAESDGPYLLDTGDQLRIFVYGQPNLSRIYTVDHAGMISVPLIGNVVARGLTTYGVASVIRDLLGRDYVRDPQVTVDIQQTRPFFILGEVRNAGQYPYVSGMTVETAIAIAGGYTDRANRRRFKISRRVNGLVEVIEAPGDYVLQAGDTVTVFERFF